MGSFFKKLAALFAVGVVSGASVAIGNAVGQKIVKKVS